MLERDCSFDFVRGVLIYLVVFGHVIVVSGQITSDAVGIGKDIVFSLIYSFHMPLFVFISGYFATHTLKKQFRECVGKVWHRLLLPALIWSVIQFIIYYLNGYGRGLDSMVMDSLRSMWFLYCIALLYFVGHCVFLSGKWKYPLALIIVVVTYLCYKLPGVVYIEYFQPIRQWPLFVMGFFYCEFRKSFSPLFLKMIVIVSAITYAGLYAWLAMNHPLEYIRSADNYILRAIIYQTGAITWLAVLQGSYRSIETSRLASFIAVIGRNTLGIYATNSKFLFLLTLLVTPAILTGIPQWFLALVITILLLGLTFILKKNKYTARFLLGEKYQIRET